MGVKILKPLKLHEEIYLAYYLHGIEYKIRGRTFLGLYEYMINKLLGFKYPRIKIRHWIKMRLYREDLKERFEVDPTTCEVKRRWYLIRKDKLEKIIKQMIDEGKIEFV